MAARMVKVAGRIMLMRDMGKLAFLRLRDDTRRYPGRRGQAAAWMSWRGTSASLLDLGDQIVVEGKLGSTKTGEITIWATSIDDGQPRRCCRRRPSGKA